MKTMKRTAALLLALFLTLSICVPPATAKTISSAKAEHVFFYAKNAEGKSVLLKGMRLSELKTLAHGQKNGKNYYISATDNYPTTQYCEGKGFTVEELLAYVKKKTTVQGADKLGFSGSDAMYFMATDGYGNYSRSWTYDELYGVKRYYFEGLYDSWSTGWEVGGSPPSGCAKPETKSSPTSCREKNGCAFWRWMQWRSRNWRMFRERGAVGFSDRLHASGRGGDG